MRAQTVPRSGMARRCIDLEKIPRLSGSAAVFSFSVMSPRRGSKCRPGNGKIVSYDKDSAMKVLNRLFIVVTVTGLATMLAPVSAHAARNLAVDDKGTLFLADTDSVS